jgi:hypothetical protein
MGSVMGPLTLQNGEFPNDYCNIKLVALWKHFYSYNISGVGRYCWARTLNITFPEIELVRH